jgi:hypothetical protein
LKTQLRPDSSNCASMKRDSALQCQSDIGAVIRTATFTSLFFFIWFVRLLVLRPLLAYSASLG